MVIVFMFNLGYSSVPVLNECKEGFLYSDYGRCLEGGGIAVGCGIGAQQ